MSTMQFYCLLYFHVQMNPIGFHELEYRMYLRNEFILYEYVHDVSGFTVHTSK